MAAELPLGQIFISNVEFDNVPIGNEEQVGDYFQLPNVNEIVLERFGVAQEYLRRKGYPPLALVTVNYRKRPRWFWARSADRTVGFVFRPNRANPDAFQIVRAGQAVHLPSNGVVVDDYIQDVAVIEVEERERDRREDAQLALDIGRLDMGGAVRPAASPASSPSVRPAVAAAVPVIEIEQMNLQQLRQFAKDNHIELPKELKRDAYLNFLKKTLDKLDKRRKHPFRITKDEKCLAGRNIKFFILVKNYYNLIMNTTLVSLKQIYNREILLGFLQEIGLVVLEGTSRVKDNRVAAYEEEILRDIDIQRAAKDDINSILADDRLKVANRTLDIVMDKRIIPASPITFQQLHDALEPSGPYVSIYTRWEVAADKNRALAYLYQMIIDHDMKSKKVPREEAIISLNRRLRTEISSNIQNYMYKFLYESVHPHLTSMYNKSYDMISSLTQTAIDLKGIGPNTTLKNKDGTILLDPRNNNPIIWTEYMNLIFEFISILPKPLRIQWAEAYLTSFIEGYDLRIDSFPRCAYGNIPVFGKPVTPNTQQYPSCILGMTYHMLLSLYQVLFEIHAPKIKVKGKLVLQVQAKPVIVARSVRLEEVTRKLARFQNEFIERNHIGENDDFTEEQKEEFREEFLGYVISTNDVNDDYDWTEIVYEIVDGALEYLGKKRRSSKQSKQSKHKRRHSTKKRKSNVKKSSVKKSSVKKSSVKKSSVKDTRGCVKQYTKKYMSRKSPAYPANQCRGRTMYGEDGIYKSTENSNGVYTWKKQN